MISFRLNEIPKGLSEQILRIDAEDLEVAHTGISRITLKLRFNRQDDHLRIECGIASDATLVCDRSLDSYSTTLESHYEVVFQHDAGEEREDLSGSLRRLDISQNVIDITREVKDSVLLSIPLKKLHPRFYKEGKITDFQVLFTGPDSETTDSRWDRLRELKKENQRN